MAAPDQRPAARLAATDLSTWAGDVPLPVADRITAFAGSMLFVYRHAGAFVVWMPWFEVSRTG